MPECIAIIPAKGTSKRIRRKNFQLCAGKSLVQRAVETAHAAGIFKPIIVSSEDLEAWNTKGPYEIYLRDKCLSQDGVTAAAVVFDVLCRRDFADTQFCVLWPTSPLRTAEFIRHMWETFDRYKYESFHTSSPRTHLHEGTAIFMRVPLFLKRLSLDFRLGDPYAIVPDEMVCDVNTPEDLAEAERRLLAREGNNVAK